jgi:hypothetical protein
MPSEGMPEGIPPAIPAWELAYTFYARESPKAHHIPFQLFHSRRPETLIPISWHSKAILGTTLSSWISQLVDFQLEVWPAGTGAVRPVRCRCGAVPVRCGAGAVWCGAGGDGGRWRPVVVVAGAAGAVWCGVVGVGVGVPPYTA